MSMEVKIIAWNVKGMNDPNKGAIIKVRVREWGRIYCVVKKLK